MAVYTSRVSQLFVRLAHDWQRQGFTPSLVVIEAGPRYSPRRLASSLKHPTDDSATVCRRLAWPFRRVAHINAAEAVEAIRAVSPDLAVNTGSRILRHPVLAIPRLGTIGVHMGLLPFYRGMNVAEWAALRGDQVGCSVFLLDGGIDTGDIVATVVVDTTGCRSRSELRSRVDDRQMALLLETLAGILAHGELLHSRPQRPADGQQFYPMHDDLLRILDARLAQAPASDCRTVTGAWPLVVAQKNVSLAGREGV